MIEALNYVNGKNLLPIVITNEKANSTMPIPRKKAAMVIDIPSNGMFSPLLAVEIL